MKALTLTLWATLVATGGSVTALPPKTLHARDDDPWQLQIEFYDNCDDVSTSHMPFGVTKGSEYIIHQITPFPDHGAKYIKWRALDGYPGTVQFGHTNDDGTYGAWDASVDQGACIPPNQYTVLQAIVTNH